MPPISVSVSGSHTHYAPAERCILSVTVSKEGETASQVYEHVTSLSNELSAHLKTLCPKTDSNSGIDINDASIAVTHWSMSSLRTSSWLPYVPYDDKKSKAENARIQQLRRRIHKATTQFTVKFKDFKRLGTFCGELVNQDEITIGSMKWTLTEVTKQKLKLSVRQGAVRDAVSKAYDYVSLFSLPSEDDTTHDGRDAWTCVAKEITDNASSGSVSRGYGAAAPMMYARSAKFGGGGGGDENEALDFTPEDVEISAGVDCKFEMIRK